MPKNKKFASGKKAARKRAAATAASFALSNERKPYGPGRNSMHHLQKWGVGPFSSDTSPPNTSMQQLALNTRNKESHWDQNSSLRGRPVIFVSGGFVEPFAENIPEKPSMGELSDGRAPEDGPKFSEERTISRTETPPSGISGPFQCTFDPDADSNDDVILFKGREARPETRQGQPSETRASSIQIAAAACVSVQLPGPLNLSDTGGLDNLITNSDDEGGSDAAINDYLENLASEDLQYMTHQFTKSHRDLGCTGGDIVIGSSNHSDNIGGEMCSQDGENESSHSDSDDENTHSRDGAEDSAPKMKRTHRQDRPAVHGALSEESSSSDSDDAWQLATDIDDEHLARLLAKQEELGMGGDDLILFDADPNQRVPGRYSQSDSSRRRSKRSPPWQKAYSFAKGYRASGGTFPSAEAVADAFEQLEVSGWSKNRNGFQLELSDSELETTLRASWQKDRMRKKEKKKAREELRAQGLLKKNTDPNDARIKYPTGMTLDDMKAEFQSFLLGSETSVSLSPMDAHARKIVHEIAYRFNIASKSTGSGDQRRPTLVRKKTTLEFDNDLFQSVFAKYRKRFFARLDGHKAGSGGFRKTTVRNGGDPGAATVRNGEIVGGSAPEIGVQNKGRTMLEKMGWSNGMALGAMDNKGMTQIIEHVVKRSKAGLG